MLKEKLIAELQNLPEGTEVCLFDYRKNFFNDSGDGEGSSSGIYKQFEISYLEKEDIVEGTKPFAVMSFDNDDYDEDEKKL